MGKRARNSRVRHLKELGIPVVDPVLAAGSIAYNLMLNKECWREDVED